MKPEHRNTTPHGKTRREYHEAEKPALCLNPSTALLRKLGAVILAGELALKPRLISDEEETFYDLLADADVQAWLSAMRRLKLLPVKNDPAR